MLDIAIAVAGGNWPEHINWEELAEAACRSALAGTPHGELAEVNFSCEVAIRLTSDDEVQQLNAQYRGKDKPTNVLSFPMVQADLLDALADTDDGEVLLGDIVMADGVVMREAQERNISVEHHVSHLIVHGFLHLLGYDHEIDSEAETMEDMERSALARIGIANPYAGDH